MPTISRSALVEHSASSMFELVCDIESYPEFLPWCSGARIAEQSDSHQLASVSISQYMPQSEFTTSNQLSVNESIQMELVKGPFKYLKGNWRFTPLGESNDASKVELDIDFEFATPVLAKMISPAFNSVCDTIMNAFLRRADELKKADGAGEGP